MRALLFSLLPLLLAQFAFAHARLKSDGNLPPRDNNPGLKTAPCGGVLATSDLSYFVRGSQITVQWEETIQHPGRYEFNISFDGEVTWQNLGTIVDTQDDPGTLPHQYEATFTLPDQTCTQCTIQMIQVMTEDPQNPRNYYSCADVSIVNSAADLPAPEPDPDPPVVNDPDDQGTQSLPSTCAVE